MMAYSSSRRDFLSRLTASGWGALVAGELARAGHLFATQLEAVQSMSSEDDFVQLRNQYLLLPEVVYLNHASIGTTPRPVHQARVKYLELCEHNPWLHMWGGQWDEPREEVRAAAADLIGCRPTDVAITHNTTEMFNVLAHGLPLKSGDEVLFSSLCHAGASLPFEQFAPAGGYRTRRFDFPVQRVPEMTAAQLVEVYAQQIRPETRLLVIPHIDNTVGLRYPVAAMAEMARQQGVEFVAVDGAQSVGMIPVDVPAMNVDLFATSPHKWLQSPKGLGLAFVHERLQRQLAPMWVTWGQQRWPDSARKFEDYGTRNLAEVLSLADAIAFSSSIAAPQRNDRLHSLWKHAQQRVDQHPRLQWNSSRDWNLSASLYAVGLNNGNAPAVAKKLFEDHQIVVRPFRTLGLNSLRVSPNVFNSKAEIDQFIECCSA